MSDATTQPPADVRGRIIRASILPIEDEETLIARLRAGAEAVERGELDAEDFAGIWSQYLRELFRRASSVPTPADVRERVAFEAFAWEHGRRGAAAEWIRAQWQGETPKRRAMYFDLADRILSLLRTPRGEGEGDALGMLHASVDEYLWEAQNNPIFDAEAAFAALSREIRAALRSKVQGDEDSAPFAYIGVETTWDADSRSVTVSERVLWDRDSATRWQAERPEDRTVTPVYHRPAALRSEAPGEDRWEDVVFGPITEAYNEAHAALRSEAQGDAEALAAEILAELRRAREKFPGNNVMTLALVEEVGELAKATFEESRDRVRQEAIQVAVLAMRVVLDGDRTLDAWREAKGLDPLVVPPAGAKEVGMASERKAYRVDAYGEAGVYFAETPAKAKYRAYRGARCAGFEPAFADFRVRRAPEYDRLPEVDGKMLWYAEMIRSRTAHPDRSESDASVS